MARMPLRIVAALALLGIGACAPAAVGLTGAAATITIVNQGADAAGSVIAAISAFLDLIEREKTKAPPAPPPAAKDKT